MQHLCIHDNIFGDLLKVWWFGPIGTLKYNAMVFYQTEDSFDLSGYNVMFPHNNNHNKMIVRRLYGIEGDGTIKNFQFASTDISFDIGVSVITCHTDFMYFATIWRMIPSGGNGAPMIGSIALSSNTASWMKTASWNVDNGSWRPTQIKPGYDGFIYVMG